MSYLTSNHQCYDLTTIRLRHQSFDIHLQVKPWVGTPIHQYLMKWLSRAEIHQFWLFCLSLFSFAAYFTHQRPGFNIIAINYELLATWDNYFTAATNAIKVGQYSADKLGHLLIEEIGQHPSLVRYLIVKITNNSHILEI